jgi:hypothetical protein
MNRQVLSIGLVMLASFSISFAVMWRQRTANEAAVSMSETTPSTAGPAQIQPPTARSVEPAVRSARARAPGPAPPAAPPATAMPMTSGPSDDVPPQALPVAFHLWNRRNLNKIEGNITNITSRPLSITMRAVNTSTQQSSETLLQLAPGEKKTFSSEDGLLDMHSGDQLILQSPPYEDRVSRIP